MPHLFFFSLSTMRGDQKCIAKVSPEKENNNIAQ